MVTDRERDEWTDLATVRERPALRIGFGKTKHYRRMLQKLLPDAELDDAIDVTNLVIERFNAAGAASGN